jgi:methionine-S-sulfoxide reductase
MNFKLILILTLLFIVGCEKMNQEIEIQENNELKTATFAAGCFWGVEEKFSKIKGVIDTEVGYTGGNIEDPTYEQVCSDKTGHAEAIQIKYDPFKITFEELLDVFWKIHDPTQVNRQGPDLGTQYRSAIFYHDKNQKQIAENSKLEEQKKYDNEIATEIVPAEEFYKGEEYHQDYYKKEKCIFC